MFGMISTRRGQSGGAGMCFRGSSPPYPYVGRGGGGLPRCQYPGLVGGTASLTINREQELNFLKNQAADLKKELSKIESRIRDLETNKKE